VADTVIEAREDIIPAAEAVSSMRRVRLSFFTQREGKEGGMPMYSQQTHPENGTGLSRRDLLTAGLAAGITLSALPLYRPSALWGAEAGPPKRGGILRVRGYDPVHFDPHQTISFKTHTTLSFVYSKLVRHKIGPDIRPGTFMVEPDLAERWEELDDTTCVFHLRKGVTWHNKPPLNGRELVAEDVKFTYDRFRTEPGNPNRYMLDPVERVEVVDRYTVQFLLKEPYVWLVNALAYPWSMWIIAPEVVQQFGDLKQPESAIGTGPFLLERYEPNVKAVFKRHPDYFRTGQPYVDGVEWLVLEDESTGLAMYRTGQIDCGPWHWWSVRQQDLEALKKTHPQLIYQDFLSNVTEAIFMRTDMPPFADVRVRRAVSHALDRQALLEAVWVRGEPTAAVARGLTEWSLSIDQLGAGAKYYQYDPKEAKRLLAEAGFPNGFKTQLTVTPGFGRDHLDDAQVVQRFLKDIGIEAELKIQEYGAYAATTAQGKFEGLVRGPYGIAWEPDSPLYRAYASDSSWNTGHVHDPTITAMLKEQRRTKDLAARKQRIFDIQQYAAEQQYYVYTSAVMITGSWQPYVKNYAPNMTFDYGSRAAALWLDR
jgi:peptide/nickel transport system substrate-binding protein